MRLLKRVGCRKFYFAVTILLLLAILLSFRSTVYFKIIKKEVVKLGEMLHVIEPSWIRLTKPLENITASYKIILFYTPYFRTVPWPVARGLVRDLRGPSGRPCKVPSCFITYSHKDLATSQDAVVFHAVSQEFPWEDEMKSLFAHKRRGQKWVWHTEENPIKTTKYPVKISNRRMDFTVTYRRNSTVLSRYGYYALNGDNTRRKEVEKLLVNNSFSSGKDRLVAWFAGNCIRPRLDIVQAITKYIQVDIFGRCQRYFTQTGECGWNTECDSRARRYKFYLAFENHQCKDYVTEKYWKNALSRDIVPIVIAGSYNKDVMVPGSFIDILDFPNAKSLANYLQYLDSNDTAYNMYFRWKAKYTVFPGITANWLCDLCELLHRNDSGESQLWDLEKFWGVKENCLADDQYIQNVWLKS